jgi:putative NADH-flavin reductase
MTKIIVLGASGALGKHVAQQAVDARHEVSAVVRTPSKLPASWRDKVKVHKADIATLSANQLGALLGGHDAVINTAGSVSDGDRFVTLVAHIVMALRPLSRQIARWRGSWREQVCWTLATRGVADWSCR